MKISDYLCVITVYEVWLFRFTSVEIYRLNGPTINKNIFLC